MMALTGPVRQLEAAPVSPEAIEPIPQAEAMAFIGGLWPAAVSTANPFAPGSPMSANTSRHVPPDRSSADTAARPSVALAT